MRASGSEPQRCTVPRIWVIRPCTLTEEPRVCVCVCVHAHTRDSVREVQPHSPSLAPCLSPSRAVVGAEWGGLRVWCRQPVSVPAPLQRGVCCVLRGEGAHPCGQHSSLDGDEATATGSCPRLRGCRPHLTTDQEESPGARWAWERPRKTAPDSVPREPGAISREGNAVSADLEPEGLP